ncbi:hypothetical protein [Bradyrhizobium ottawaense]|uniref:hypothetical protein n=1 Tax=Bradyrhizobium ottawaense TaxID=931866 RepID=UPI0030F4887A
MTDPIKPPWTPEQVDALNRFQRLGVFHPFTCPDPHDGADRALVATRDGWVCCHCDYRQDWAHSSMLDAPRLGAPGGTQSPLRDLILHIDRVARYHIAYPQAADALKHLRDHLSALAFCEETNQRQAGDASAPAYRR